MKMQSRIPVLLLFCVIGWGPVAFSEVDSLEHSIDTLSDQFDAVVSANELLQNPKLLRPYLDREAVFRLSLRLKLRALGPNPVTIELAREWIGNLREKLARVGKPETKLREWKEAVYAYHYVAGYINAAMALNEEYHSGQDTVVNTEEGPVFLGDQWAKLSGALVAFRDKLNQARPY